jgi:hypothetical protein
VLQEKSLPQKIFLAPQKNFLAPQRSLCVERH